jgi:hypothetical protein
LTTTGILPVPLFAAYRSRGEQPELAANMRAPFIKPVNNLPKPRPDFVAAGRKTTSGCPTDNHQPLSA